MSETSWFGPLLALAIGAIIGVAFLLRARGFAPDVDRTLATKDLRARFDELIDRLRALGPPSSDEDPTRLALEIEAAGVLRDLDAAVAVEMERPVLPPARMRPQTRLLLWMTALATASAVIYVLLLFNTVPRTDAPMTGDQTLAAAPRPDVDALQARVSADPEDSRARLDLARAFLDEGRMLEVWQQTEAVLAKDPDNARALSYQSLVLLAGGDAERAEAMARRAIEIDPRLVEGWLHLALVQYRRGDIESALAQLESARRVSPADGPLLDQIAAEMRAEVRKASEPAEFTGTIELDSDAAARFNGAPLFVIVRARGVSAGPPAAAVRLAVTGASIPFTVRGSDAVMGGTIPSKGRVEARIDTDGDPMTRDEAPAGSVDADRGASGLVIRLQ